MPKTDAELRDLHFSRDPSLAGDIADQFGVGGGDATALIQANEMRYPVELTIANDLAWDEDRQDALIAEAGGKKEWLAAVADAAGIDKVSGASVRGDYVTYNFTLPDGRVGKDALILDDDGTLELPDRPDTPERAAMRAQAASARALKDARSDADRIIDEAKAKAADILREASERALQDTADAKAKASRAQAEREGESGVSEPAPAPTPASDSGSAPSEGSEDPLDKLDLEGAKAEAESLNLDVTGTGANGNIKRSDYIAALKAHRDSGS